MASEKDKTRTESGTGSNMGRTIEATCLRDRVYPTNVIVQAPEYGNKQHPAVFPGAIPRWFILLFTDEGDTVLDPFAGSGTTLVEAAKLQRRALGIEISDEYIGLINQNVKPDLFTQ